jgi:4-aminobutyrate aminotransferase-like enzyme
VTIQHADEPLGNALREAQDRYIGRGQSTYTPTQLVVARAEGVYLWSADGRRLTDFTSGVLVGNLGYAHPRFEARLAAHRAGLPRNSYNMVTGVQVEASRRLVAGMGRARLEKVLWAASGSEGIQKALWCALHRHPERPVMLATRAGFHGKKGLANDVSGTESRNPDVRFLPFPGRDALDEAGLHAALEAAWAADGRRIGLLITEPYLGAAGSYHPPAWYHRTLEAWCRAHDVAFIFDEVQSCFGRTGRMYAFETHGVEPDLVVLGKGLANGEPAAAVVGRADLIDALDYGEASDTFSGCPGACAAVCAALDVFESEDIVGQVQAMAGPLRAGLERLQARFDFVREIRGEGFVYGLEIADAETAGRCVLEAYRGDGARGVHFLGPLAGKVLRVSPPLVMTRAELDEALGLLEAAWARV